MSRGVVTIDGKTLTLEFFEHTNEADLLLTQLDSVLEQMDTEQTPHGQHQRPLPTGGTAAQ